jgi:WD40 repeat protein/formylglycine-generating enzyme required for sulfatase activity
MPFMAPSSDDRSELKQRQQKLSRQLADILLSKNSPVKEASTFQQDWQQHQALCERQQSLALLDSKLLEVLPGIEQRERKVAEAKKAVAQEVKTLRQFAAELGNTAFGAVLSGDVAATSRFEVRKTLHDHLEKLSHEKDALGQVDASKLTEKVKLKAQQLKMAGEIKMGQLKIGSLDRALGESLLNEKEEASVDCPQTTQVLQAITGQRAAIASTAKTQNDALSQLTGTLDKAARTLDRESVEGATVLQAELKQVRKEARSIEKSIVTAREAIVRKALEDESLRDSEQLGPNLKQLWSTQFDLKASQSQVSKAADNVTSRLSTLSQPVKYTIYGAAGCLLLIVLVVWFGKGDDGTSLPEENQAAESTGAAGSPTPLVATATLVLKGHSDNVGNVAFSPDGKRIVSSSNDKTLKVWDAETGKEMLTLKGHSGIVTSGAFSPDGKRIVSCSMEDTMLRIWDAETGKVTHPQIDLIPPGQHSRLKQEILRRKAIIFSVSYSTDGKRIVGGGLRGPIKVWNAKTGKEMLTLKGHSGAVASVAFSPDDKRIVSSGSTDKTLKVWDAETGKEMLTLNPGNVTSAAFSPDGKWIVSTGNKLSVTESEVYIWDSETGKEMLTLNGHSYGVWSVSFSPDGERIVSGGDDTTVKVWDAKTGQEMLTLKEHTAGVRSVCFSPDGKRIVSSSDDNTVIVWDLANDESTDDARAEAVDDQDQPQKVGTTDRQAASTDNKVAAAKTLDLAAAKKRMTSTQLALGDPVVNGIGMLLVPIPAGAFQMGTPESGSFRIMSQETPQHLVKITKPFYLGVYEVTQGQYENVMRTRPWQGKGFVQEGSDYPATWVNWGDAVAFCRKLSKQEGVEYRLPTEAEWEYACRAGTTTAFSFGDDASKLGQYAWYNKSAWDIGEEYAHGVGRKLPNPWGLYDLHGNVWEWCQDWYARYGSETVSDPKGPAQGKYRLLRSGAFRHIPTYARSAFRFYGQPGSRNANGGFRVARTYR